MSFGTPKGRARMPAVTMAVPPPPPMPTTASRSVAAGSEGGEGLGHGGDGGAAVVGGGDRRARRCRVSIVGARVPTSTTRGAAGLADARGEEGELLALGVGGADDVDMAHRAVQQPSASAIRALCGEGSLPVCRSPGALLVACAAGLPARKQDCFRFETTVSY